MEENQEVEIIGNYGATLSLIEVGVGSTLHAFRVPFASVFLSLNQGYMLCRSSVKAKNLGGSWTPYQISNIAAVLKSFSPAGKKLGPMLSLSMQGLLFNLGTLFFGVNIFGLSLGMGLLSLWGFCQPVLTYYLFFGKDIFKAFHYMLEKTLPFFGLSLENLISLLLFIVILKAVTAITIAIWSYSKASELYEEKLLSSTQSVHVKTNDLPPLKGALLDLTKPIFIFSLLITGVFLYFTEDKKAEMIWALMRPLGIGFIFFYFSRTLTLEKWLLRMEKGRFRNFSLAAKEALKKIKS
jgi:hypothetical protein